MKKVRIYKKYERFWHWTQAVLILSLAVTGFEVHGSYELLGYQDAVLIHRNLAWAFMILIVFTLFWNMVTGEWRQYIPSTKMIKAQIEYYITGIFKNAPHPTRKTVYNKFNPIQRLTYLGLRVLIIPVVVLSGLVYMYYSLIIEHQIGTPLTPVAYIHTIGAFLLIGFVIGHVYLTTTGHKPMSAIKAMLTGWEEMSNEDAEIALEENLKVAMIESRKSISGRGSVEKEHMFEKAFEEATESLGIETESTRLREKLLKSNVGYFRINKDGLYEEVNDAWLNLYKCAIKEDVIGSHYSLNRTPEDKKKIEAFVNRVLSGETLSGERVSRVCTDGSVGYHTVSAKPYYKDGEIAGLEGFIIDITEQVKAEQELERKLEMEHKYHDFYKKISESEGVGYFRIGKDGFYQDVNDTWLKLYRYDSKDEIIGKHYSLSRTKEDFVELKNSVEKVLQGETIPFGETRRYCKDGTVGYHTITMTPVYEDDKIVGFEGFIVDITEKKEAENELRKKRQN